MDDAAFGILVFPLLSPTRQAFITTDLNAARR